MKEAPENHAPKSANERIKAYRKRKAEAELIELRGVFVPKAAYQEARQLLLDWLAAKKN